MFVYTVARPNCVGWLQLKADFLDWCGLRDTGFVSGILTGGFENLKSSENEKKKAFNKLSDVILTVTLML